MTLRDRGRDRVTGLESGSVLGCKTVGVLAALRVLVGVGYTCSGGCTRGVGAFVAVRVLVALRVLFSWQWVYYEPKILGHSQG